MPAFLTHRAAGERVLARIDSKAISHKMAFYLGCQGPDLLYFRNYQPWRYSKDSLSLGTAMHKLKTRELMTHALGYLKQYGGLDKDELISYIAGFITHYAIDKNAHPFVYVKAGKNVYIHHAMELMWDSYSAKEQWGIDPYQFNFFYEIMYKDMGPGVTGWYISAAKDVYNKELGANIIGQAQYHFAKAKRSLANVRLPGKIVIKLLSTFIGFDVSTMLYPRHRDESLFSRDEYGYMQHLISKGVSDACDMTNFMLEYINKIIEEQLPVSFGDKNFAGE
ncbi:MAG: zinc dependent phospholipase C family protein [Christensenellales bacterium]|jgi:hypothetical protein